MSKNKSPLKRLRGSVVDYKNPFEPIEEGAWESLETKSRSVNKNFATKKDKKRSQRERNNDTD